MRFEIKKNGVSTIFKLRERRLDATISSKLKGEFILICKPKMKELIIDLSDVEFCDSSGLSALLIAERKMREIGGKVKLAGLQQKVLSLIKISHLDWSFEIYDSLASALKNK